MLQPKTRKRNRYFSESGCELFRVGEMWMRKRDIARQFRDYEAKGLVTVRRSLTETPVYVELNFHPGHIDVGFGPIPRHRSKLVTQRVGQRYLDAQAWAIQEVREEIKKRFRESNK